MIKKRKKQMVIALIAFSIFLPLFAQPQTLHLEECYRLAEANYPLVRQRSLIDQARSYTVENAAKGYWPQLSIAGQATYQSAVTELPLSLPGVNVPQLSKDQYKIYGELNQTLYDNGVIRNQQKIADNTARTEQQQTEVDLYQLRERINQLFFGVLVADAQLAQVSLLESDIRSGLDKVNASIAQGTALRSNADVLQVQLLQAGQRRTELNAARKAYTDMLSVFIGQAIDSAVFAVPDMPVLREEIARPELAVFGLQKEGLEQQQKLLNARSLPRFSFFVQGGAGRPALNFLSNDFEGYYIGGLRLNWNIGSLYTLGKEKKILDLSRERSDVRRDVFLFNTQLGMKQYNAEIRKFRALLASDEEIVALRSRIKETAMAQLSHGVITGNDYLREVNSEDKARQDRALHQIQLLLAAYQYQTTTGH